MDAKELYRRFVDEVVVGGDVGLIDELFDPDLELHAGEAEKSYMRRWQRRRPGWRAQ